MQFRREVGQKVQAMYLAIDSQKDSACNEMCVSKAKFNNNKSDWSSDNSLKS
jgi:hypothetical protein